MEMALATIQELTKKVSTLESSRNSEVVMTEFEFAGEVVLRENGRLRFDQTRVDSSVKENHASLIYMIRVDGETKKIGKSESTGGINGTMSPYICGDRGSPSKRTFGVNCLLKEQLQKGYKVEIFVAFMNHLQFTIPIDGALAMVDGYYPVNEVEKSIVCAYKERQGIYPDWNFQESIQIEYSKHIANTRTMKDIKSRLPRSPLHKYTVKELKSLVKERGIKGYSKLRKNELVMILEQ